MTKEPLTVINDSSGYLSIISGTGEINSLRLIQNCVWFLLGLFVGILLKVAILLPEILSYLFQIPEEISGDFVANVIAMVFISFIIGIIICYLVHPTSYRSLEYYVIFGISLIMAHGLLFLYPKPIFRFLYYIITVVLGIVIGALEIGGIISSLDVRERKTRNLRLVLFLLGHLAAYTIMLALSFIAQSVFGEDDEDDLYNAQFVYIVSDMMIGSIIGIPVATLLHKIPKKRTHFEENKMNTNIISSRIFYIEGNRLMRKCSHYLYIILVMELMEGFLNSSVHLYVTDPFPQVNSTAIAIFVLFNMQMLEIFGILIPPFFRGTIVTHPLPNSRRCPDEKELFDDPMAEEILRLNPDINSCDIPEIRTRFSIRKYNGVLKYLWIPLSFKIITGILIMTYRHYEPYEITYSFHPLNFIVATTLINSTIRGIIISYVYTSLYDQYVITYLNEHKITMFSYSSEHDACVDMRINASTSALLATGLFFIIQNIVFCISIYIGYKYQRIIYEAESIRYETNVWPTDNISNYFLKFIWWPYQVILLIWRDIKHPFQSI